MADFLPNKPNINVDTDDFIYKNWFQSVWKYTQGENAVAIKQTVSFTCSPEVFDYPCDTQGGPITVTLPPATDCMGKKYSITHVLGSGLLSVVPSKKASLYKPFP